MKIIQKSKTAHFLLIAALAAAAILPIILMIVISSGEKPDYYSQTITSSGKEYSYREYLVGCIMSALAFTDEPPCEKDTAGINATAAAINSSLIYLVRTDSIDHIGFPSLDMMNADEQKSHFGEELDTYLAAAQTAADYAMSVNITYEGKNVFLPVCRISSGGLISRSDMPWVKKLYCPRDKYAAYYNGGCQLTCDGIAAVLLSRYSDMILSPDKANWISDIKCDDSGNVLSLNVCGINMSGSEFAELFGIRSICFEMSYSEGLYTFTTKGDGCSTGLSVYAALQLSRSGQSEKEILDTFFNVSIA